MTSDSELPDLATAYALDAVSEVERVDIERRLADAPVEIAEAFRAEVRAVRESMAIASSTTATTPPASLRRRALAVSRDSHRDRFRWRTGLVAAAAALVVAAGGFGAGLAFRPSAPTSAEQVFSAGDVRTATGQLNAGGTATFVYSRDERTGVLVMNNAAPPPEGMVYQMWLMTDQGPKSAGMMATMLPSTTAMVRDLGDSTALAFTMEPDGGSSQPTGEMVARLTLT
ncbi:anti-sigma factor [Mycolicibacterium septicum]|uniref:anti-sigma factor n=1 Tax=Mycolicibacterium septicum TaxID=98668 RepID=UPI001AFAD958|nr:anti-sigma factor [Mycolicibacterium septicum]QRY53966.1 anti-sigma factor [Mycolicibacterium septicum]